MVRLEGCGIIKCDQCNEMMINGVRCHERGCPNDNKAYDPDCGQWVNVYTCWVCGYEVQEGEVCSCHTETDW